MDIFRIFICIIVYTCICGCIPESVQEVQAEFISVTDSKPCTDSLYIEWTKERDCPKTVNPRFIELLYVIKNFSSETIYVPLKGWNDSVVESSIIVDLIDENKTIKPIVNIKKIPYDSNYINPGDSMIVFVELNHFDKWASKRINTNTDIDTILSIMRLQYSKSIIDKKDGYEIPNIKFDNKPQYNYVIPRGASIDAL